MLGPVVHMLLKDVLSSNSKYSLATLEFPLYLFVQLITSSKIMMTMSNTIIVNSLNLRNCS